MKVTRETIVSSLSTNGKVGNRSSGCRHGRNGPARSRESLSRAGNTAEERRAASQVDTRVVTAELGKAQTAIIEEAKKPRNRCSTKVAGSWTAESQQVDADLARAKAGSGRRPAQAAIRAGAARGETSRYAGAIGTTYGKRGTNCSWSWGPRTARVPHRRPVAIEGDCQSELQEAESAASVARINLDRGCHPRSHGWHGLRFRSEDRSALIPAIRWPKWESLIAIE